ncbi:MAG: hypothetical protein PHT58_08215 [Eubacteriales bacterium]|nr:hypothetical protein [Eubacteriales bacterium]
MGAPPTEIGERFFDNCAPEFTIFYPAACASSWAPNGETTWNGYPIKPFELPQGSFTVTDEGGATKTQPIMSDMESGFLFNIPAGTTAEQLASAIGATDIGVMGKLKTGDVISYCGMELTIAIAGDVDCDAQITAADASKILRAIVKLEELNDIQSIAANTQNAAEYTASDAAKILRWIVKYEFTIGIICD